MSHIPERTCMGCNKKDCKSNFVRIVKNGNEVLIDKTGKMNGRGAYICNNVECLEKVIKSKRLERCLKGKIDNEIYQRLRGVIIEQR